MSAANVSLSSMHFEGNTADGKAGGGNGGGVAAFVLSMGRSQPHQQ